MATEADAFSHLETQGYKERERGDFVEKEENQSAYDLKANVCCSASAFDVGIPLCLVCVCPLFVVFK